MKWTWEKAKLVLSTVVTVLVLLGMVGAAWASLNLKTEQRMDRMDRRMTRLVEIVEIEAILNTESKDSPEYTIALSKLRAMRGVMSDLP